MSRSGTRVFFAVAVLAGVGIAAGLASIDRPADRPAPIFDGPGFPLADRVPPVETVAPAPAVVAPAPLPVLTPEVKKALDWIVEHQGTDGGFGQNDANRPDVANTAIAALALLRAGNTPKSGPQRAALLAAVEFVRKSVAASKDDDPFVTELRGTQPQGKIGPHVDTFLSCQLLGEVDGLMPDAASQRLVREALDRCVKKTQSTQAEDGSFNQGGWAPVLGSTFACRALQIAEVKGAKVDRDALARAEDYMLGLRNKESGNFRADEGAGVNLYAMSSAGYALSKPVAAQSPTGVAGGSSTPAVDVKVIDQATVDAAADALKSPETLRGFGSMGGEEFVSYMMASTAIANSGGGGAVQWNDQIRTNLASLQNADGSWAGAHCITGRVFCTSSAVLTLLETSNPKVASAK